MTAMLALSTIGMQAKEYYASPTGTGDGSSYDKAGSFSTMRGKLSAGDVLYLLGGQYDLTTTQTFSKSGNASNYITVCAYGDEKPILDFRKQANGDSNNGLKVSGNYIHFKSITIRYAGYKGIWLEGSKYCILENLDVYGCCNAGIQLRSGGNNLIINCDSHENFDYQANGGNADGFADKQGNACAGNIYIGCRAWGNSDDGWDSYQRVTSGTPTVYINCITWNNGPITFDLSNHPRVLGVDKNLSCFSGKDLKKFPNGGNPNGFKLGGKGTIHNTELYRCLAVGHRGKGYDQNNNAGNMKVINCTAYGNDINYGFGNDYAFTLAAYNNVSLAHISKAWVRSDKGTTTQGHNTWNSGYSCSESDFEGFDIESMISAERNSDGSLPETMQFHLKATATNLIDKGQNYTDFSGEEISSYVSYKGSAPDIGCYEYSGSTAIEGLTIDEGMPNPNAPRYNLAGQRVDDSYKGIVIQGGKKFLVK